jgi:cytochrome o ubiquinol oxidase operon protein cyoD
MSHSEKTSDPSRSDTAPGDEHLDGHDIAGDVGSYLIGLALATLLTIVSFFIAQTTLV